MMEEILRHLAQKTVLYFLGMIISEMMQHDATSLVSSAEFLDVPRVGHGSIEQCG